jgi:ribosome-binding factor A
MAYRKEKLEKQMLRLVSELLIREIKDPRIGFVTITGIQLNHDFSVARIGVSILGNAKDMKKSLEGLQSASGFIQSRVSKAMRMRLTPRFEFYPDSSIADGVRMVGMLNTLEEKEAAEKPADVPEDDEDNE